MAPNPLKLLHLADLHLDRPFVGLALEDARTRRRELRGALERCLALAAEHRVDAITIGGDLWEDEHVTPDTRRWVADRLEHAAVPVVLVAGNHDPLRPGGPHQRVQWPSNVRILPAHPELHREQIGPLSLWGMSWGATPLTAQALDTFSTPPDGDRHLLLLHGTAGGAAFEQGAHCPFTAAAVRAAGFELCLAGHLHRGGVRDGIVVYPGSPEPLAWDETGRHTVALVELPPAAPPRIELIDVNQRRCAETAVDCDGARSSADIERALRAAIAQVGASAGLCLRAALRGRIAPDCRVDLDDLAAALAGAGLALLELSDQTQPAFDLDTLAAQPTAIGLFVRDLRERIAHCDTADPQRPRLELALDLGLRAMHGDELAHVA